MFLLLGVKGVGAVKVVGVKRLGIYKFILQSELIISFMLYVFRLK